MSDEKKQIAIVDGSNVAYSTERKQPRLKNILLMCDKLQEDGLEPIIVVDAALRHQIDQEQQYEEMVQRGSIRQAPAGTDADFFIVSFARELDASVVSNDRFRDHSNAFPELDDRLIRFMIVNEEVVLERRTRRRD